MNESNHHKLKTGGLAMFLCLAAAHVLGDTTNAAPETRVIVDGASGNVALAMYAMVINNKASLLVILLLAVWNYILDDVPEINWRYVRIFSVLTGASIYWAFTTPDAIPKSFPHPFAVYISNGSVCGLVAWLGHRHIVLWLAKQLNRFLPENKTTVP